MPTLLSPEEIATQGAPDASPNRLPSPHVFAGRAERLRKLAEGHAMADFLAFAARLADAQQTLLDRLGPNVWHDTPAAAFVIATTDWPLFNEWTRSATPVTSSCNVRPRSVTGVPAGTAPPGVRYSRSRESCATPSHSTLLSAPWPARIVSTWLDAS